MFIQTQETPNPNSLKFFPGRILTKDRIVEYTNYEEAKNSSILAAQLLSIKGVTNVMFNSDYIAISIENCEWKHLKPPIIDVIISYFLQYDEVFVSSPVPSSVQEFFDEKDIKIVNCIKELLETHIREAVAKDGGDIKFRGYKDGIVYLSMHGACSGCPSAGATLKQGVENLFQHFIPQIKAVEQI